MKTVIAACAASLLLLAGCGPSTGSGNGALGDAVGAGTAPYALLDLQDRSVSYARDLPDLQTNATYRDRVMVFHRTGVTGAAFSPAYSR